MQTLKLLICWIWLVSPLPYMAQSDGIRFFEGSWQSALGLAESTQQLVFVHAQTSWSGPSRMMLRNTYNREDVGVFFNRYFVNLIIDMESGDGLALKEKYGVSTYPTLLFINYRGDLVYREVGYKDPSTLLRIGQEALKPERNHANLELKVQAGSNEPKVLLDYALNLYKQNYDYREAARRYFATQSDKDLYKNTKNWIAIHSLVWETDSREFRYLLEKRNKFTRRYGEKTVDEKIVAVLRKQVLAAGLLRNRTQYEAALGMALDYLPEPGIPVQRLKMSYAEAAKNWPDYALKTIDYFAMVDKPEYAELLAASRNFLYHVGDPDQLVNALSWIQAAIRLRSIHESHDVYARLLLKAGQYGQALTIARQSLALARQENQSAETLDRAEALIEQVKEMQAFRGRRE